MPVRCFIAALLALAACVSAPGNGDATSTTDPAGCADAQPLSFNGKPSGFVSCADGSMDRVSAETFDPTIPDDRCNGHEREYSCRQDSDCSDHPHGACLDRYRDQYSDVKVCSCAYACASDADCAAGYICMPPVYRFYPAEDFAYCVPAGCSTGADCASGECGAGFDCSAVITCRDPADGCRVSADCGTDHFCDPATWTCFDIGPLCYDE